jgi:glutamate N-acetyltransferase/amino-acid N-acetyltransferase
MSDAVSPLAPKKQPKMPSIEGVRIATAEAGIKYKNRTDVCDGLRRGHECRGRVHTLEVPVGPRRFLPANLTGGKPARPCRQFRQRQRLHRHEGPRNDPNMTRGGRQAAGCAPGEVFLASTGVIGEPLDAGRFDGVLER